MALETKLSDKNLTAEQFWEIIPPFGGHIPHQETWKLLSLLINENQSVNQELATAIQHYLDSVTDVVVRKKITGKIRQKK